MIYIDNKSPNRVSLVPNADLHTDREAVFHAADMMIMIIMRAINFRVNGNRYAGMIAD